MYWKPDLLKVKWYYFKENPFEIKIKPEKLHNYFVHSSPWEKAFQISIQLGASFHKKELIIPLLLSKIY